MSSQSKSELGPEAGGWLHEPCWAAEAQTKKPSWRDKDLNLESFVSGHSPYENCKDEPCTPMAEDVESASQRYPSRSIVGRGITSITHQSKSSGGPATKSASGDVPHQRSSLASLTIYPEIVQSAASSHGYFPSTSLASHLTATTPDHIVEMSTGSFKQYNGNPVGMEFNIPEGNSTRGGGHSHGEKTQSVAWLEVRSLREDILVLRSRVREKRAELRRLEAQKAETDNLLFKRMVKSIYLGDEVPQGTDDKPLYELMEDCQKARNAYGPEEYECTALEDELSRLEFKLTRLEQPFFSQAVEPRFPLLPVDNAIGPALASHHSNTWSILDDDFDEPNHHPLVTKFLSKQGDLDLLHERRDNILDEKRSLEEEKESRSRFGMALNEDDQAWLNGSRAEHDSLARDIDFLEKELVQLKLQCISQGLVDEDGEPKRFEVLAEASFHSEKGLDVGAGAQTSEYVKHPILLSLRPGRDSQDFKKYEPKPDPMLDLPTTTINDWMLKSLRKSPLEVSILARIYESGGKEADTQWELAVLRVWFEDTRLVRPVGKSSSGRSSLITETDNSHHAKSTHPEVDHGSVISTSFLLGRTSVYAQSHDDELMFSLDRSPTPLWSDISWRSI